MLALSASSLLCISSRAQGFHGLNDVDAVGTSYHRFVRPGEPTVQVLLLGNAVATGMYVVGAETDIAQLLALSGATFGGSTGGERVSVNVRLYRDGGGNRNVVAEASIEDVLSDPTRFPDLSDGDIVYVESVSSTRTSMFEIVRTISSIATLAFVVERLISAAR